MSNSKDQQLPALSEISESAASGSVAALYADIRAVLGVDLVNLIYRHLATVPGGLEWAWANLRPHFQSGEIDAQAELLRNDVRGAFPSWPEDFAFAPSHPSELTSAAGLTQVYNINNSRNLIAFRHLLDESAVLTPMATVTNLRTTSAQTSNANPLPAIPSWEAISAVDRETVIRINRLGESQEPTIVGSLYRHLALWPSLLGGLEPALMRIDARGDITRALAFTAESSRNIARAHPLSMPITAPEAVDGSLLARLRAFVDVTIPKMVPVGLAIESALAIKTPSPQRETPDT